MIKKERFKLFELSLLEEGHSGFKYLNESIDEFLSDNFESGYSQKNSLYKFPIFQRKINSANKKKNNLNNSKFGRNREILKEVNKNFNINKPRFKNYEKKSQLKLKNLANNLKRNDSKKFHGFNKSKKSIVINLDNESNNNNIELLSFESSQDLHFHSPKNRTHNRFNFLIQKKDIKTPRIRSSNLIRNVINKNNDNNNNNENNNFQGLSFTNFIANRINNIDIKNQKSSDPQSPSSTMVKTRIKNVSFKSDNDNYNSESFTIEKNINKLKRVKSAFSRQSKEDSYNKSNFSNLDDDDELNLQSKFFTHKDRKKIRQKIKLKRLLYQIDLANKKHVFIPNELDIKLGYSALKKFKREKFLIRGKSASQKNLFFFKFPFQINKFVRLNKKNKMKFLPHQNILNDKSKNIMCYLKKLKNNVIKEKKVIKSDKNNIELKNLKYFVQKVRKKDFDKKIDELFKKEAVKYQGKMGKFFIYKGNGIFSGHLKTLLKGDKIAHNLVKLENI